MSKWFKRNGILFRPVSWQGWLLYGLWACSGYALFQADHGPSLSDRILDGILGPCLLGMAVFNAILYAAWLFSSKR